jgi:hypothetical protein
MIVPVGYLIDIVEAAGEIEEFVANQSFESFAISGPRNAATTPPPMTREMATPRQARSAASAAAKR